MRELYSWAFCLEAISELCWREGRHTELGLAGEGRNIGAHRGQSSRDLQDRVLKRRELRREKTPLICISIVVSHWCTKQTNKKAPQSRAYRLGEYKRKYEHKLYFFFDIFYVSTLILGDIKLNQRNYIIKATNMYALYIVLSGQRRGKGTCKIKYPLTSKRLCLRTTLFLPEWDTIFPSLE